MISIDRLKEIRDSGMDRRPWLLWGVTDKERREIIEQWFLMGEGTSFYDAVCELIQQAQLKKNITDNILNIVKNSLYIVLFVGIQFISCNAWAGSIHTFPPEVACIVGESAAEPWHGQVAIGEAIRNRGTLKGVYGCKAKFIHQEPFWVWKKAAMAWEKSAETNLTDGATHWESTDFPKPYWAYGAEVTAHIGKHVFYKGVK